MTWIFNKKTAVLMAFACLLPAQTLATGELPALAQLERGRWQLTNPATPDAAADSICLGDPILLMKLEHQGVTCSHEVVASNATGGAIHYTCPGNGFGRTSIRVETPRLAKIDTQGIASNRPFAYRLQAKRVGPC
jgi:hypothetical protein